MGGSSHRSDCWDLACVKKETDQFFLHKESYIIGSNIGSSLGISRSSL